MYHIAVKGVQQGPITEAEVREKIARGELQAADLCWREGWAGWKRIEEAFPSGGASVPPPLAPAAPQASEANPFTGTPKRCGLATVSLVCGICTLVLFPLFILFMIPAIVCGHVAQSRIKKAKGALVGGGMALAGLIMGYMGVAVVPVAGLMAAMAIPAFQKVREQSVNKTMDNDARQIAAAAQQYFLETDNKQVAITYDRTTGTVGGPLAQYIKQLGKGYTTFPSELTSEGGFELAHPNAGPPHGYDAEGKRQY